MFKLPIDFPPGTKYAQAFVDLLLILKQGDQDYFADHKLRGTPSRAQRRRRPRDPDYKSRPQRKAELRAYALERMKG